jgi:hypothetical protein
VSANIVILEEAAFILPELFYQVIVPLLGVKDTALLAISTPQDGRIIQLCVLVYGAGAS